MLRLDPDLCVMPCSELFFPSAIPRTFHARHNGRSHDPMTSHTTSFQGSLIPRRLQKMFLIFLSNQSLIDRKKYRGFLHTNAQNFKNMHCPLLIALTALFCLATAIPAPIDGSHSLNITVSEAPNSSMFFPPTDPQASS